MVDGNWAFFKGLIPGVYLVSSWENAVEADCEAFVLLVLLRLSDLNHAIGCLIEAEKGIIL